MFSKPKYPFGQGTYLQFKMPTDPVCGMQIAISDAVTSVQHDGMTYYFCSDECRQRFTEQPTVYTN